MLTIPCPLFTGKQAASYNAEIFVGLTDVCDCRMLESSSGNSFRLRVWMLAALLLVFTAWRFLAIPHLYMREDEQLSFQYTEGTLIDTLNYQATQDNQAPLWYAVFWMWGQVAGRTETAARVLSILMSALTAALTYQLGRRWFSDWRVGAFSVFALMLSAYAFIGMMEIRPYSLVMVVAPASMLALDRWLKRQTLNTALVYGVTLALMLYTHYFLAFLILFQGVMLIFSRMPRRTLIRQGSAAAAIGVLLWLPQLPVLISQLTALRRLAEQASQVYGIGIGVPHTHEPTSWETFSRLIVHLSNGQAVVLAVFIALGTAWLWRRRGFWWAAGWGIGVPVGMLIVNAFAAVYAGRYVVHASIGVAILCAAVVFSARSRLVTFGLAAAFSISMVWSFGSALPVRVPYRDLFAAINASSQPGDQVLFLRADENDNLVSWHIRTYLSPAIGRLPGADAIPASGTRRLWFVTANWFDDDVQREFTRLEADFPVRQVIGQCDRAWCYLAQLMIAPPLTDPLIFGGQVPFFGAEAAWEDAHTLSVRTYWRTEQPVPADYSIGVHLLDVNGVLIAQDDSAIRHYGEQLVQTSQMEPGQIYQDVRRLILPDSAAGREARLALVVYQSWDGVRLTLADGADHLDLPLPPRR